MAPVRLVTFGRDSKMTSPLPRAVIAALLFLALPAAPARPAEPGGRSLNVSENKRYLVRPDGSPFFYLGDTAWELFHRLGREEADLYLKDRADKRFTVIQAAVLAEFEGLKVPNAYGHTPLLDNDPARPNPKYFEHVDYVVDKAASLGMFVGMLPTWGDKVNKKWGVGPEVFTPANAEAYGKFLGERYRDKPIIWILGGDRPVENDNHLAVWRAMAKGIRAGDGGRHLMTYHPMGGTSSSDKLHAEPWLDFNTYQSGHSHRDAATWDMAARDYAREPAKPTLDSEPCYEDHPIDWKPEKGWFDDYDVRKAVYRSLFAGGAGVTYGCHDIWQFLSDKHPPVSSARTPWRQAINLPGSSQVQHARALLESRPYLTRVPDQSLLASDPGSGPDHVRATRDAEGTYALLYCPTGKPVTVHVGKLAGPVRAAWFDPRTGRATPAGEFENAGSREFTPPVTDTAKDWVLILDVRSKGHPLDFGSAK
jgi:hypothetical protein